MDSLEKIKQQLSASIAARQSLETTYEMQFAKLSQFIAKLSYVCRGIDVELDNRLAKLRKELKKNVDIEKVEPLLDEINQLLKHQETRSAQHLKLTQQTLTEAGKTLQKQRGLPDTLRRQLRSLLTDVSSTDQTTIHGLVPSLEALTRLYQEAFNAKNGILEIPGERSEASNTHSAPVTTTPDIQDRISQELLNVISELAFEGNNAKQIDTIRKNLVQGQSLSELADVSLNIIKLIVSSISEERDSAQFFLVTLNDALSHVQKAVLTSLSKSKHINDEMSALNDKIQGQIKNLSMQSEKATSLVQLQQLVSKNLKVITDSMLQKEELEREEKTMLLDSLSVMENRLAEVEKTATNYKKSLSEQRFKSLQDALTKLPNRAAFDERMEVEYRRWKRYGHSLCLAVIDIDHFKRINDTYGHSAGDRTLRVIAQSLRKTLRTTDFIARFGGEEFVVLIPEASVNIIEGPLNKVRESIKRIPFKFKDQSVQITISIGATAFNEGDSAQVVFDRADSALYEAKNSGRDKVIVRTK